AVVGDGDTPARRPEERPEPLGARAGRVLDGAAAYRPSRGDARGDRDVVAGYGAAREGDLCTARARLSARDGAAAPSRRERADTRERARAGNFLARPGWLAGERRVFARSVHARPQVRAER